MRDFISELAAVAKDRRSSVGPAALKAWERRAEMELPEEVRRLYLALDGGTFAGDVQLHPLASLIVGAGSGLLELGTRGAGRLVMVTREDFVRHGGGASLPSWMEPLEPQTWLFAVREKADGPLKPSRTLEGVLDRVLPPRETEMFGEMTFARGMSAVSEALASLPSGLENALRVLIPSGLKRVAASVKPKPKPKPAAKTKTKTKTNAKAKASRASPSAKRKAPARLRAPAKSSKPRTTTPTKRGRPSPAKPRR